MTRTIAPEVVERFVEEATAQVVSIRSQIDRYFGDRDQLEALEEARRLTHRVKGEASMIGLADFSQLAHYQEQLLEQAVGDSSELRDAVLPLVLTLNTSLHDYLSALPNGAGSSSLRDALVAYRRFLDLPADEDEVEWQRLAGSSLLTDKSTHATSVVENAKSPETPETRDIQGQLKATRAEATSTRGFTLPAGQREAFCQDVADRMQIVTDLLNAPSPLEEDDLGEIRRSLHSVKGAASVIGLSTIAELAHAAEDFLQRLAEDGAEMTSERRTFLQRLVDTICELADGNDAQTSVAELFEKLGARSVTEEVHQLATSGAAATAARSAGTVSDAELDAIRQDLAHRVSEELLAVYREEAEDHLKQLYNGLNSLQTAIHDRTFLQAIRRSAHTLKGAAGAVGLRVVTKLAHRMEDLLDLLYEGAKPVTPSILVLLLDTTDRLHDLSLDSYDQEDQLVRIATLYNEYAQLLNPQPSERVASEIAIQSAIRPTPSATPVPFVRNQEVVEDDGAVQSRAPHDRRVNDQMLRVPIGRVDELVRTVSELIINRTTFEQRMTDFVRCVDELRPVLGRLRSVANEMETRYSIDQLRGGTLRRSEYPVTSPVSSDPRHLEEFDTLEFDRYNEFHLLARTISESTSDVNTITNELRTLIGDFDSLLVRQDRLSRDTQDRLMRIRMVPLAALATRLHRAVRVVATGQGKRVDFIIEGEDTELDKTVLEEIIDPLLHLLRNAVDHGVEPPDLRLVKGKPEQATIRVRAFYQGTQVVLRISDDGSGLDAQRIVQAAIKRGHLSAAEAEAMTAQEIFPYIFVPGLSTAAQVSEVSGRGVGMDIVRDKVQRLKGTITVDSEPDKGTTFTIRLPMTMAVTRALLVVSGKELFAVPMQSIVQIARLDKTQIERLGNDPIIRLDGHACPLIRLSEHLHLREVEDEGSTIPVIIVRSGDRQVAVRVEKILSGRDVVVKTLGTHLRKVPGLVGATLLGDGTIVPILDPNTLSTADTPATPIPHRSTTPTRETTMNVMIVDDSVSVRRVMENLIHAQGWVPLVAKDGLDAIEILQSVDVVPDIFLLDIEMPRMDGFELLATLRSMPKFRQTPIVMVTSRAGEKHRTKALSLGASEYLIKPYQDDALIATIQRLRTRQRESALV